MQNEDQNASMTHKNLPCTVNSLSWNCDGDIKPNDDVLQQYGYRSNWSPISATISLLSFNSGYKEL